MSEEKYEILKDLLYTETHEWVRKEGDMVVVGITDYAQKMLHEIVFVELPKTGTVVSKGKSFMNIESVKAVSDIHAPISGKIVEVNEDLETYPEKVNESPYEEAWMAKIEPSNPEEMESLLEAGSYEDAVAKESA